MSITNCLLIFVRSRSWSTLTSSRMSIRHCSSWRSLLTFHGLAPSMRRSSWWVICRSQNPGIAWVIHLSVLSASRWTLRLWWRDPRWSVDRKCLHAALLTRHSDIWGNQHFCLSPHRWLGIQRNQTGQLNIHWTSLQFRTLEPKGYLWIQSDCVILSL